MIHIHWRWSIENIFLGLPHTTILVWSRLQNSVYIYIYICINGIQFYIVFFMWSNCMVHLRRLEPWGPEASSGLYVCSCHRCWCLMTGAYIQISHSLHIPFMHELHDTPISLLLPFGTQVGMYIYVIMIQYIYIYQSCSCTYTLHIYIYTYSCI